MAFILATFLCVFLIGAGCDDQSQIQDLIAPTQQKSGYVQDAGLSEFATPTKAENDTSDAVVAPSVQNQAAPKPTTKPVEAPLTVPKETYTNVDGNEVPSSYAAPSKPVGASAQCRDGTYSFSQHRQGTCSHHGGVAEWY
ncbi:DUF3761 domain-containing protein [Patescibacteria group bacterium]|nr:DUF3761 domain-containing protein [Patescibacteria group bacterium]